MVPCTFSVSERKAIVEAEDWEGPSYEAAMNAASVCRKFETSRQREDLTFKHHAEVAALPPDEADALLDWCEATSKPRSTRELRGEIHRRRVKIGERPSNDTCKIDDLFAAAAPALSIMIKSLSCRLRPDAEKFAAPAHSLHPAALARGQTECIGEVILGGLN